MFDKPIQTRNQQVHLPVLKEKKVQLFVKREDEIHPLVSGNKFRKLKYNIKEAKEQEFDTLLTFGGAYSNHILATAVAAKLNGLRSIGVIRGEELGSDLEHTLTTNPTLDAAHKNGMQFVFVSREAYREKTKNDFLQMLRQEHSRFYIVPEGGTNELAVKGCEEILTDEDTTFDYICSCIGTGGTIAGLIRSAKSHQKVIGFPALKGDFLISEVKKYVDQSDNWELQTGYHFGGYAKYNSELIHFINQFKKETTIPLDPIYTGKMVYGVLEMIKQGQFPVGSKIVLIHTGGLQGIAGFNNRLKIKNKELRIR